MSVAKASPFSFVIKLLLCTLVLVLLLLICNETDARAILTQRNLFLIALVVSLMYFGLRLLSLIWLTIFYHRFEVTRLVPAGAMLIITSSFFLYNAWLKHGVDQVLEQQALAILASCQTDDSCPVSHSSQQPFNHAGVNYHIYVERSDSKILLYLPLGLDTQYLLAIDLAQASITNGYYDFNR